MAFPVAGLSIAAISLIPAFIASSQKKELSQLKQCEKFPSNSKPNQKGYYWLRGSLQSTDSIIVDINTGNFVNSKKFGIMRYEVDRCIESKHIEKYKVEEKKSNDKKQENERKEGEQPGAAPKAKPKQFKEEKRSRYIKSYENVHRSPIQYASILEINNVNINDFRDLFPLNQQYETFTSSPDLNGSINNSNQNTFNLNLNIGTNSNNNNDILGEQDRKTIGYRHRWYGVNIGDQYTIIGYWDGDQFVKGDGMNIVDGQNYYEIVKGYENSIWWLRTITMAGLLVSGGVGIRETNLFSKL